MPRPHQPALEPNSHPTAAGEAGGSGDPVTTGSALEVLAVFTRLGLSSFGGPVAHLGYFHAEVVRRRRWLDEGAYADLVALCQFLPGPTSSQVGIGIGIARAGLLGGLAAWLGFTLPSALLMLAFALGVRSIDQVDAAWLHGLKIAAVAVVAHAVWGMGVALTPDRPRIAVALVTAVLVSVLPGSLVQAAAIVGGGLVGWLWLPGPPAKPVAADPTRVTRRLGLVALALFFGLLLALPLLSETSDDRRLAMVDAFYRSGSLVFGGGHVVLPLLQAAVVDPGWVDEATFVAGYGAAQAVPGPLFTFAAYLGGVMAPGWAGVGSSALALLAIFLPSFLLLVGVLPFWATLRLMPAVQAALRGVNAAVVGLLLAALLHPVWTSAVREASDVGLAFLAWLALAIWRWPPWLVVLATTVVAWWVQHL